MNNRIHDSPVSPKDDLGKAGAPENEIEITPEMVREVSSIISSADYRFEDEKDVAMKILHSLINKFL
jgi:hypothetical protein